MPVRIDHPYHVVERDLREAESYHRRNRAENGDLDKELADHARATGAKRRTYRQLGRARPRPRRHERGDVRGRDEQDQYEHRDQTGHHQVEGVVIAGERQRANRGRGAGFTRLLGPRIGAELRRRAIPLEPIAQDSKHREF